MVAARTDTSSRTGAYIHFLVSAVSEVTTDYRNKTRTSNTACTYIGQWWLSPCFPSAGLWSASVSRCCVTSSLAQTVSYVSEIFLLSFLHPKLREENIILKVFCIHCELLDSFIQEPLSLWTTWRREASSSAYLSTFTSPATQDSMTSAKRQLQFLAGF